MEKIIHRRDKLKDDIKTDSTDLQSLRRLSHEISLDGVKNKLSICNQIKCCSIAVAILFCSD